jgi:hypothetical protein
MEVWLQMAAWSAAYGTDYVSAHNAFANGILTWWGQSAIANITLGLGPTLGPGAVIWTFSTNTSGTVIPAVLVATVPEPATLALVALATAMLVARRRFRRRAVL